MRRATVPDWTTSCAAPPADRSTSVWRPRRWVTPPPPPRPFSYLQWHLNQQVIAHAAGTVAAPCRGGAPGVGALVLFPGQSNAGKSTLVAGLVRAGLRLRHRRAGGADAGPGPGPGRGLSQGHHPRPGVVAPVRRPARPGGGRGGRPRPVRIVPDRLAGLAGRVAGRSPGLGPGGGGRGARGPGGPDRVPPLRARRDHRRRAPVRGSRPGRADRSLPQPGQDRTRRAGHPGRRGATRTRLPLTMGGLDAAVERVSVLAQDA